MDRIVSFSHDRTSLLSTHKVLRNTYFLLSLTLAFSAITGNCQYGADAAISGSDF
ncbi:putative carrier/transport protein [Escherichia coli]|uniref:Putative carrier/transport protein n=1 Tax=Escherichia coli TaxID=562 RepID=A0A376YC72_ECOLX|nr:putative carrier/transport protein [Escherichia coli]